MNQIEDQLRDAYGHERFTRTVTEIEARARKSRRRRRTSVSLALAGGITVATILIYLVVPLPQASPPPTGPVQPRPPISRLEDCRRGMALEALVKLRNQSPIEVVAGEDVAYIFFDDDSAAGCLVGKGNSGMSITAPAAIAANGPLRQTIPDYVVVGTPDHDLVVARIPYGMGRLEYFTEAGVHELDTPSVAAYGLIPAARWDFNGVKASEQSSGVFTAKAIRNLSEPATTPGAQLAACQATQQLMPVPGTELTLVDRREVTEETSVLLLAGGDELLAVCRVHHGATINQATFIVGNHAIFLSPLEVGVPGTQTGQAVVLMRRFPEDAGSARVVLGNGQTVPLVFTNGFATAWFTQPGGAQADHLEVDLKSGGHTDYPK